MSSVDKILIMRFSSLGDVIIAASFIKPLRDHFPNAHIAFLVFKKYQDLFIHNPDIDSLMTFECRENLADLYRALKNIIKLRKQKFDLLIDLHQNEWCLPRTIFWDYLFRKSIKSITKIKAKALSFETVRNTNGAGDGKFYHTLDVYRKYLSAFGISKFYAKPQIYIPHKDTEFADNYLDKNGIERNDSLIGIIPGASYPVKQWPEEKFMELCRRLSLEKNIKLIIFVDSKDRELARRIAGRIDTCRIVTAIGLDLLQLASLIARCKTIITNDSGPMHMAAAVNTPVIAIFGPTHPKLGFSPLGENNTLRFSNIPCSPCSRWGEKKCRYKKQLCFEDIKVEDVFNETIKKLCFHNPAEKALIF